MADEPGWEDIFLPKAEPTEPASGGFPPALPPQVGLEPPAWQQPVAPRHPAAAQQPGQWQAPAPQHPPAWQQPTVQQPTAWQPPVAPQAAPQPPVQGWPQQPPAAAPPPAAQAPQAWPQQVPSQPAQAYPPPAPQPPQYPPTQAYPTNPTAAEPAAAAPHPAAAPADPFAALFATTNETPAQPAPAAAPPAPPTSAAVPPAAPPAQRPAESGDPFAALFASVPSASPASGPAAAVDPAPGAPDDPFAALFPTAPAHVATVPAGSRRDTREGSGGRGRGGDGSGGGGGYGQPRRKRSLLWLKITLPIVLVLGAVGGVAAFGWFNYNEQVRELLGIPLPTDYEGTGNGEEVVVTIRSGDIGSDVANTLHTAGVTMTFDAVYDYLIENPDIGFTPGNWALQREMSAESAVAALQDPANKVTSRLLIIEGSVLPDVLEIIASTTGIDLAGVQAAAADPTLYGVPAEAPSLEGYLFPATYELDGAETAEGIIRMLVDETFARLDAAGVAPESRHSVLTLAALIQREAGSNPDDFYKVSRVFLNRIEQGMLLQSDATVAYGTGNLHTVWTTDAERADANNPYNTYVHPGLPVGPIGAAGDRAIDAALHPADGPWLYFVPIDLATGETVFSETVEEHEAAVQLLHDWCEASDENASYCE